MIERLFAKELVGFDRLEIEFSPGLVAVTGPSGAGKSVFMSALLALMGKSDVTASLSEVTLRKSPLLELESFDDGEEDVRVRAVKKEKVRYYLNDLTISKKRLEGLLSSVMRHISQRVSNDLDEEALLSLVDAMAAVEDPGFTARLADFSDLYETHRQKMARLQKLREDEARVNELIEFAEFEIKKIDELAPRVGEDEELMGIKRKLSKKEKITEAIARASAIFDLEDDVVEALALIEGDATLFSEAMNMLRGEFERAEVMLEELDDVDVEGVLDRIEALSELKRRYGSIEEALAYRDRKLEELERYRHIDHEMEGLAQEVEKLTLSLKKEAENLTKIRRKAIPGVEAFVNRYLRELRMPALRLKLTTAPMGRSGEDGVDIDLQGSSLKTLSGGEFNRIRLALLLCRSELAGGEGVLLIDEIDANVSGDESIAIAKLLKKLSKTYQVIAISHQPHLSAAADQHLKVGKEQGRSVVAVLSDEDRVAEISRMIAGERGMEEARALAGNLLREFHA